MIFGPKQKISMTGLSGFKRDPSTPMKYKQLIKHKNANNVADDVMKNGILLGCHHGLKINDLTYICSLFNKFAKTKEL